MIKAFQLRAARSVIGAGVKEIAVFLNVSKTIVSKWENMDYFSEIKSSATNPESLIFFFEQHNIVFPDDFSIAYKVPKNKSLEIKVLSRFQFRAARNILQLSQRELALATESLPSIINYLENCDNTQCLNALPRNIDVEIYKRFFESKKITFPDSYTIKVSE